MQVLAIWYIVASSLTLAILIGHGLLFYRLVTKRTGRELSFVGKAIFIAIWYPVWMYAIFTSFFGRGVAEVKS